MKSVNKTYHLSVIQDVRLGGIETLNARNEAVLRFLLIAYASWNSTEAQHRKIKMLNNIIKGLNSLGCEFNLDSLIGIVGGKEIHKAVA